MSKNMILILYVNFNFVLFWHVYETNICYWNIDFCPMMRDNDDPWLHAYARCIEGNEYMRR